MQELFYILLSLEKDENAHVARILLLLRAFAGSENKGEIEGLTKLAKLDFLLRYPVYLERALDYKHQNYKRVNILEHERRSVESQMVRFKYGPWDFRYRQFINILVAKGLVYIRPEDKTFNLGLTPEGLILADSLKQEQAHSDIYTRSQIIHRNFDYSGTYLKDFIYKVFPEIVTLQYGKKIT